MFAVQDGGGRVISEPLGFLSLMMAAVGSV